MNKLFWKYYDAETQGGGGGGQEWRNISKGLCILFALGFGLNMFDLDFSKFNCKISDYLDEGGGPNFDRK